MGRAACAHCPASAVVAGRSEPSERARCAASRACSAASRARCAVLRARSAVRCASSAARLCPVRHSTRIDSPGVRDPYIVVQ
jgi:hypothetical protein